jgi:hypothetical protein
MSLGQKHCKEEEEEELAGDLREKRTYFVFVRERHYWETHILHTKLKKPIFFNKGVQGIRRQEIATKRLCILKELITQSRFLLALEISRDFDGEQTWYIER